MTKKWSAILCFKILVIFCKRKNEAKYMKTYFNSMKETKISRHQGKLDKV